MYVNSRFVKCPAFQKSIDMVYKNLIGNLRYPFVVLNLEIPAQDVDVNVHPTKKEVRYKNPNQIFNFIYYIDYFITYILIYLLTLSHKTL